MQEQATKRCRRCAKVKPTAEFSRKASAKDRLQPCCKQCSQEYYVAYYSRHKDAIVARNYRGTKKRRAMLRQFVWDYLLQHPCVDCGEADPAVLEFDHVRGQKLSSIASMVIGGFERQRVIAEIDKCEVRCANCHRRRTAVQFGWYQSLNQSEGP